MDIVIPPEFKSLWEQNARHPVVKYPAEVLRVKAAPVERVDTEVRELISRLVKAMDMANGIGLAAPQLGALQRVCIIAPGDVAIPLINPEVLRSEGEAVAEEGCLSLPCLYGDVTRPATVEVRALDLDGNEVDYRMEGLAARVAQHEIDHLDGVLFIDKVDVATLHWAWPARTATPAE